MDRYMPQKFELHYYFGDDTHTMDAIVRNECERELLALFKECSNIIGIECSIESEAALEGGLREIWNFVGSPHAALLVAVLAVVMSRFPPTDNAKEEQEEQLLELQTEEARLNIEKLRLEIEKLKEKPSDKEVIKEIADGISKSSKVLVRRSNFYEKSIKYQKIKKITYTPLSVEGEPIEEPLLVRRGDFHHFIIHSKILRPITVENAEIEIVSPVLREGNYKWKGIYDGKLISFSMTDSEFRYQVQSKQVTFQNGSMVICALDIQRKLDEAGEIITTGYSVPVVISKYDSIQEFQTPQGKSYLQARKNEKSQRDLFRS